MNDQSSVIHQLLIQLADELIPSLKIIHPSAKFIAILDSGCSESLIELKLANQLQAVITPQVDRTSTVMNNTKLVLTGLTYIHIKIGRRVSYHRFYTVEKLPVSCVLGSDFIYDNDIVLHLRAKEFWFGSNSNEKFKLIGCTGSIGTALLTRITPELTQSEDPVIQDQIENFLMKFPTVSRQDGKLGCTNWTQHMIETEGIPPSQNPYRKSPAINQHIKTHIQDMLKNGLIRPSRSPYAAPVVLVLKKDGRHRFCVDYTRLNAQTKTNAAPMENAHSILRQIPAGYWYSVIDLHSRYWQIKLHPDSIEKSAFVTQDGHFEFLVMPFGLKNAPKTFQQLMRKVLQGYDDFVKVFIDDTIVYSATLEQDWSHLEKVFTRLKLAGLTTLRKQFL